MKKIRLEYSNELLDFCNKEEFRFTISIIEDYKFIIIEFEEVDFDEMFELGMEFEKYKNSLKK